MINSRSQPLYNVQVLRGLAAIGVIFSHLSGLYADFFHVGQDAGAGVDIFFVISGFIMVYTTRNRAIGPAPFMTDRIIRIVPLYWLVTLAMFVIAVIAPRILHSTDTNLTDLLKSLFFVPYLKSSGLVVPVLLVGWTLNYEMFFYLVFALWLALPNKIIGASGAALSLLCLVGIGAMIQPVDPIAQFYTNPIMLEFALGMMIGLLQPHLPARMHFAIKLPMTLLVLASLLIVFALPGMFPNVSTFLVCGLPATFIVGSAVALERWGWTVESNLLLLMGNASYAIYLTHMFVLGAIDTVVSHWHLGGFGVLAVVIAAMLSACAAGVVVHYSVEQPLSRFCKSFRRAYG